MKSIIKFFIAVAMVFSFVSCGVSMADTTAEKIDGVADGYKGGLCAQPGDKCFDDLVCGKTKDGEKVCMEPVAVTDDSETPDNNIPGDTDGDGKVDKVADNECFGLCACYDDVPNHCSLYGVNGEGNDYVFTINPESKCFCAPDGACSMICYKGANDSEQLKSGRCEGITFDENGDPKECNTATLLDMENPGDKGCSWNCK